MEPAEIKIGSTYRHERSGEDFIVLKHVRVKEAEDVTWYAGIEFYPASEKNLAESERTCYVRFQTDFRKKFTLVEEGQENASS